MLSYLLSCVSSYTVAAAAFALTAAILSTIPGPSPLSARGTRYAI